MTTTYPIAFPMVPPYAKVSTVGVAATVVSPHIDLAMPAFPPADEGTTTKVSTWTWTKTDYESVFGSSDGISPVSWQQAISTSVFATVATGVVSPGPDHNPGGYVYANVGVPLGDMSVPESMCGNCRRDWHEVPLTEAVARMWDSVRFDETYDPATDDSRVVCPGSEDYGPILSVASGGSIPPGNTYTLTVAVSEQMTPWSDYCFDKDIEMDHNPPVSPGLDFSESSIGQQPLKGKKKK